MNEVKYVHLESTHNTESPGQIVPVIYQMLNPRSVADVGCGIGTFLYCFKQEGVKKVLGIDGPWVDKSLKAKYLSDYEFMETDLEKPFTLPNKFDLALSLEVAEHIDEKCADVFIENLVKLSDVILFSAAIPNQGGQNHLNEQPPSYWEQKFKKYGFEFRDELRKIFWENEKIFWWYKQNMFLVVKTGCKINHDYLHEKSSQNVLTLIHPELFKYNTQVADISTAKLLQIENGEYSIKIYWKLLYRAFLRKAGRLPKFLPTLIFNPKFPNQK